MPWPMYAQILAIHLPTRYGPVLALLAAVFMTTGPEAAAQSSASRKWQVKTAPPESLLLNDTPVDAVAVEKSTPGFSPITPMAFVVPQNFDDENLLQESDLGVPSVVPPAIVPESSQRRDISDSSASGSSRRRSRNASFATTAVRSCAASIKERPSSSRAMEHPSVN